MRTGTKTIIGLLTLGATGAIVYWRSQQARASTSRAFEEAKQTLDRAGVPSLSSDQRQPAPPPTASVNGHQSQQTSTEAVPRQPASAPSAAPDEQKQLLVAQPPEDAPSSSADDAPPSAPALAEDAEDATPIEDAEDATPIEDAEDAAPIEDAEDAAPIEDVEDAAPIEDVEDAEDAVPPPSAEVFTPNDDPDAGELDADGDDRTIADRVRSQLGRQLEMGDLPRLNINVEKGGVVYVRGVVQTAIQSALVEQVVRDTEDVTAVVNELSIEQGGEQFEDAPQPAPTSDAPNPAADAGHLDADGDDRTTTDRVRTHLGRELEGDHLARLNVNTQADGVVYLRGAVQSQEQREWIELIVRETEGVTNVVNELHVDQQTAD